MNFFEIIRINEIEEKFKNCYEQKTIILNTSSNPFLDASSQLFFLF